MSEQQKPDETIYERTRREVQEREAAERARRERGEEFLHREPSPAMRELKGRFDR